MTIAAEIASLSQRDLIDYIVNVHHVYTRDELNRLSELLQKVLSAHGGRHRELLIVPRSANSSMTCCCIWRRKKTFSSLTS